MQTKRLMTIAAMWVVFIFGLGNLCFGQSYWKKTYGGSYYDDFTAIQPTADGNFLIVGNTDYGAGVSNGWLVKIKPNGDTLWTKTYDRAYGDKFYAIQPTADGNFLIVGYTGTYRAGNFDGLLLKITLNGDTVWTKIYDGTGISVIQPTADGNFLIAGTSKGIAGLIKIKPNGDTLWMKTYGVAVFSAIQSITDGNFLIAGYTSNAEGLNESYLLRIKPNGDTLWAKMYGVASNYFLAIQPTSDGNFLIAGNTWSNGAGNSDGWLLKIKPNGDTLWTKTYGGTSDDNFSAIQPTTDGNFLIAGYTSQSPSEIDQKGWLIKIKPNGDTLWTKTDYNHFTTIQPISNGNFLIAGIENDTTHYSLTVLCIIADQYAYKNSLFTYKIPVYSSDTLNFGYVPLKTPSGMTVSAGGTVSWTPKTDSVYMDHAEFLVVNDLGKKDTLTFNIFVNSDYHPPLAVKPFKINKSELKPFEINATLLSGKVQFSMPSFAKSISIYDMNGRQVGKAAPIMSGSEASVIWPSATSGSSAIPTGKYIAKASAGMNSATKPFLLVR